MIVVNITGPWVAGNLSHANIDHNLFVASDGGSRTGKFSTSIIIAVIANCEGAEVHCAYATATAKFAWARSPC